MRAKYTKTLLELRQVAETEKQAAVALVPLRQGGKMDAPLKRRSSGAALCRARIALSRTPQYEVRHCTRSSTALLRDVSLNARTTSPAPFHFACLQEKVLLIVRVCRLRFCDAEPIHCLLELGQPSFVAVVHLVALTPTCPCLRSEKLRRIQDNGFPWD